MKKFILAVLMGLVVSQANAFSAAGHYVAAHTSVAPHAAVIAAPKPATPIVAPVKSVVVPPVRPVVTPIVLPHVGSVKKCKDKEKGCK